MISIKEKGRPFTEEGTAGSMILAASGQKKEGMWDECDAQRHRYCAGLTVLLSSFSTKTPVPGSICHLRIMVRVDSNPFPLQARAGGKHEGPGLS